MTEVSDFSSCNLDELNAREVLAELFSGAHTAYSFTDEPVSDQQLHAAYDLAQWAPTGVNGQPLRVAIVRSGAAKQNLLNALPRGNREQAQGAPLVLVCGSKLDFHHDLPSLHPRGERYEQLLAANGEMRTLMAHTSATIQIAYLILALRAQGLETGPMNPDDAQLLHDYFFPGEDIDPILVINVGYAGTDAYQERGPRVGYDEVFREPQVNA
ncbi:malonic semialdehyde reductase [uncultured Actinomyces sp.]|uniref:malonic semialdehyde reductase n=1 Tax=uncultured Actinomyces sp. TaxID=249061 RepID=UPI0015C19671|nr:malonic semialdehyde reductase [uncultured Actinomyces sp.]